LALAAATSAFALVTVMVVVGLKPLEIPVCGFTVRFELISFPVVSALGIF